MGVIYEVCCSLSPILLAGHRQVFFFVLLLSLHRHLKQLAIMGCCCKGFFPSPSLNISSSRGGCMVNLMRELIWLKITFYFLLKCKRLFFSEINPPVKFTAGCTDASTGREELFPPCLLTDHSSQPGYLLDSRNCNLI